MHRWYETGTGRYTKTDPLTLGLFRSATPPNGFTPTEAYVNALVRAGNPKFEMSYGYAVQNPLVYYDPDGRIIPLVCAIPPVVAALGEALAVTVTVLSATAAGVAVADWWNDRKDCDQCERDERDKYCHPAYLADIAACQARHGADHRMRRACEGAAAARYASCLGGEPLPPLMP